MASPAHRQLVLANRRVATLPANAPGMVEKDTILAPGKASGKNGASHGGGNPLERVFCRGLNGFTMKNFLRAVRLALRYRWTVVGAILCSLGIALLWSANIGTVYPIIEVVFQDKSVPQWADEEVQKLQAATRSSRQEISRQQDLLKGAGTTTAAECKKQQHQLSLTQAQLVSEEEALSWALWMQPYAHKMLPPPRTKGTPRSSSSIASRPASTTPHTNSGRTLWMQPLCPQDAPASQNEQNSEELQVL